MTRAGTGDGFGGRLRHPTRYGDFEPVEIEMEALKRLLDAAVEHQSLLAAEPASGEWGRIQKEATAIRIGVLEVVRSAIGGYPAELKLWGGEIAPPIFGPERGDE